MICFILWVRFNKKREYKTPSIQHRILNTSPYNWKTMAQMIKMRDHLVGKAAHDWLAVKDSRETLLLVA